MNKKRGTSLIEVIVVIVILSIGIIGAYGILDGGQKLAYTTENRIKAINIAREGIEAVQNIRDTNWIKFSSDYTHCWNTKNYDDGCIGGNPGHRIISGSYKLLQNASSNWELSSAISPSAVYTTYMTQFPVSYDTDGLTIQALSPSKCSAYNSKSCLSIFSREVVISYPDAGGNPETATQMEIHSVVKWRDNSKDGVYTIDIPTTLTDWMGAEYLPPTPPVPPPPVPTCSDGIKNGTETGVDCGGSCPVCPPPPVPTCSDGIKNGTETGVDCGGSCPVCAPTCSDGIKNGTETGVDCGGSCGICPEYYPGCSIANVQMTSDNSIWSACDVGTSGAGQNSMFYQRGRNDMSFTTTNSNPYDWKIPQDNSLWPSGVSSPCAAGYHVPNQSEWQSVTTYAGVPDYRRMRDEMRLNTSGYKDYTTGVVGGMMMGYYWSSTVSGTQSIGITINNTAVWNGADTWSKIIPYDRAYGFNIRCKKD